MIPAVCLIIIMAVFIGDLSLKNHIEQMELPQGGEKKFLGGRLLIRRHHNTGMAFNIARDRRTLAAVLSLAVTLLAAVVFIFSLGQYGNHLMRIGLSLLLGGAFSNTYDRLRRKYVVDYFSFGVRWKWLNKWIFNISDFCILTGALLAVLGAAR